MTRHGTDFRRALANDGFNEVLTRELPLELGGDHCAVASGVRHAQRDGPEGTLLPIGTRYRT